MKEISAESFAQLYTRKELGDAVLLDVREQEEWEVYHLEGSLLIPLGSLPFTWSRLDPGKKIYVLCAHGVRSLHAAHFLYRQGYHQVVNVEGGLARVSLYMP